MTDRYSKYYLDDTKIDNILKNGIAVFDTSALLDLYFYAEKTQEEIFKKVFEYFKNRLWIPSQVYFEFLKNKTKVSEKPIESYKKLIKGQSKKDGDGFVEAIMEKAKELGSGVVIVGNK